MQTEKPSTHTVTPLIRSLCQHIENPKFVVFKKMLNKLKPGEIDSLFYWPEHGHITLLHLALLHHLEAFAQELLNRKASTNNIDSKAISSLHLAAQNGYEHIVRRIAAKENLNLRDDQDRTALCLAAKNGHLQVVKFLCEQPNIILLPVFPESMDSKQYYSSPLGLAILCNQRDVIVYLLEILPRKLPKELLSCELRRMLCLSQILKLSGKSNFVKIVNDSFIQCTGDKTVYRAVLLEIVEEYIFRDDDSILEKLIQTTGLSPNSKISFCTSHVVIHSPLIHYAISLNKLQCIRKLLALKADINELRSDGKNALSLACANGNAAVVKLLLETGKCNLNEILSIDSYNTKKLDSNVLKKAITFHNHNTIPSYYTNLLDITLRASILSKIEIIELLLAAGAEPSLAIKGCPIALYSAISLITKKFETDITPEDYEIARLVFQKSKEVFSGEWVICDCVFIPAILANNAFLMYCILDRSDAKKFLDDRAMERFLIIAWTYEMDVAVATLIQYGADRNFSHQDFGALTVGQWLEKKQSQKLKNQSIITDDVEEDIALKAGQKDADPHKTITIEISKKDSSVESSTYFQSQTEISMSKRKYLMEVLGLPSEAVESYSITAKRTHKKRVISSITGISKTIVIYTWENGLVSSTSLEAISNSVNCYYLFPSKLLENQLTKARCPASLLNDFKTVRAKFHPDHLKALNEITLCISINGIDRQITHELKVKNSKARILIIELPSDNGKAKLYIPAYFLENGLHNYSDIKSLLAQDRNITLDLLDELNIAQDAINSNDAAQGSPPQKFQCKV